MGRGRGGGAPEAQRKEGRKELSRRGRGETGVLPGKGERAVVGTAGKSHAGVAADPRRGLGRQRYPLSLCLSRLNINHPLLCPHNYFSTGRMKRERGNEGRETFP